MSKRIGIGILGSLIIVGIVLSALNTGAIGTFLDLNSFLFVFGVSITATLVTGVNIKKRIKIFSSTSVAAGWLGFIIGLILITGELDFISNYEAIFPAISVALTTIFYGYMAKLFCDIWLRVLKERDL